MHHNPPETPCLRQNFPCLTVADQLDFPLLQSNLRLVEYPRIALLCNGLDRARLLVLLQEGTWVGGGVGLHVGEGDKSLAVRWCIAGGVHAAAY